MEEKLVIASYYNPNEYNLFNKNTVKLNHSRMPNVANIIHKNNTKKLNNKQHIDFPWCNWIK